MSQNYLDGDDTDEEEEVKNAKVYNPEEILEAQTNCGLLKSQGNDSFSASNFDEAIVHYTNALKCLKSVGLKNDAIILLNRSATYISLKRYYLIHYM